MSRMQQTNCKLDQDTKTLSVMGLCESAVVLQISLRAEFQWKDETNLHRDTMQCANNVFLVSPITEFTREEKAGGKGCNKPSKHILF